MASGPIRGVIRHLRRATLLRDGADLSDGQLLECFLARRDEAAFEALVRRHGPMVLGVCRRVLHDGHDAEDAFQATFLVLVRKARSIVPRERVGNWLHGVAYRTALRARSAAALRRAKERQVRDMPRGEPLPGDGWEDVQPLLDHELNQLPEKYRVAIVLCDLQGKTRREAARQLGWPEGTLSCRLARGRALLAQRLSRRGVQVSAAALALGLAQAATAVVPAPLLGQTTAALAGAAPPVACALAEGVLKAMLLTRLKIGAVLLLALGFVVAGAGALQSSGTAAGQEEVKAVAAPAAGKPAGKTPPKRYEVRGQVRHEDGQEVWSLDFRFKDPRLIQVAAPATQGTFWYLCYEVVNATGKPRTFIPEFELVVAGEPGGRQDQVLPTVHEAIRKREFRALGREEMMGEQGQAKIHEAIRKLEDPARLLDLKDSITIAAGPVPPSKPGAAAQGVKALAIWSEVPVDVEGFTVFVSGLSNAWVAVDKETVRRKTLQLTFRRHDQQMRFVPPAQWVYRTTKLRVAPPAEGKEKEKEKDRAKDFEKLRQEQRLYLKQLQLAQEAWRTIAQPAIKKAVQGIESALQELRRQTQDDETELAALREIERQVKELQEKILVARGHRKELEKLQGIWATRKVQIGGSASLPQEILPLPLTNLGSVAIVGDRFITRMAGQDPEKLPAIRLDPTHKPAAIDFLVGKRLIRAVYELEGETLRICFGDGERRPASCEARDGVVVTYQRKKL